MKRITFLILSCMISCMTFAQTWSCPEFDSDLAKYNEVAKKYKSSGNKKWSQMLLEAFPVTSENTIKYQYVIKSDSTFNVADISNSLLSWYKTKTPNAVPNASGSPEHLSVIAVLQNVGRAIGYMNATFISAREEITVAIKENRVRATVTVLNYFGANTWNGVESIAPGGCYPVNAKGSQKDSHAMAFINCHSDAINTIAGLIKYLNNNTKTIMEGNDEW